MSNPKKSPIPIVINSSFVFFLLFAVLVLIMLDLSTVAFLVLGTIAVFILGYLLGRITRQIMRGKTK